LGGDIFGVHIDDAEGPDADSEPALGWANTGPQLRLTRCDGEDEPDADFEPDREDEPNGDEGDYSGYVGE
jgi:hypothetical protein